MQTTLSIGDVVTIEKRFEGRILLFIPDVQARQFNVRVVAERHQSPRWLGEVQEFVEVYALNGEGLEKGTRLWFDLEDIRND